MKTRHITSYFPIHDNNEYLQIKQKCGAILQNLKPINLKVDISQLLNNTRNTRKITFHFCLKKMLVFKSQFNKTFVCNEFPFQEYFCDHLCGAVGKVSACSAGIRYRHWFKSQLLLFGLSSLLTHLEKYFGSYTHMRDSEAAPGCQLWNGPDSAIKIT